MNISITEARDRLMQLPDDLAGVATVTRHGKPVLAVIPWDLYEGILETLEILADPQLMDSIKRGLQDAKAGKTTDLDRVIEDLGLA